MMNTRIKIIASLVAFIVAFAVVLYYRTTHPTQTIIAPAPAGQNLPNAYSNSAMGFSLHLPDGYRTDESYRYQAFGPSKDISGVKFTIPESFATGTNLGADTYISVEEIPQNNSSADKCTTSLFLEQGTAHLLTDGNTTYSVASSTGAGAGNRYEETVYALPNSHPCIAVRYFVHYSVLENYPAGAVRAFDRQALLAQFDAIRHSLIVP
jgi:hypothetical protein